MIKCQNCNFENIDDGIFCQECGSKLNALNSEIKEKYVWTCDYCDQEFSTKTESDSHEKKCLKNPHHLKNKNHSLYEKLSSNTLDDVIFNPQKKSHTFRNIVIFIFIIFSGFFILVLFANSNSFSSDTAATPTKSQLNMSYLVNNLSISNYDIKWIGNETYFVGTIKNNNYQHIKDVIVRIDFAWDKAMSKLFDTRYVTIDSVPSNGAFSFQIPVNVYQNGQYWYQYKIESAETL